MKMVDHVYGSLGPPKSDIPGEEASTIGVRFHMLPNGEVHVSEVSLPATTERPSASLRGPCSQLGV